MISLLKPFELALVDFPFKVPNKDYKFYEYENQVIYIENAYDQEIDHFVQKNLSSIEEIFNAEGLHFIYVPERIKELKVYKLEAKAQYLMPWLSNEASLKHINIEDLTTTDIFGSQYCGGAKAGVIFSDSKIYNGYKLEFQPGLEFELFRQIATAYRKHIYEQERKERNSIRFQVVPELSSEQEEELYTAIKVERDPEIQLLIAKIKELKPTAIERQIILKALDEVKIISPLHITASNEILLPEYQNMSIHLTPLQKALYFLFLKHPEGISTYDMPLFRDELIQLYKRVTKRSDMEANIASIDKILDRFDNARSEHIAKIRYAFISKFSEDIAQEYLIIRDEQGVMKINLSPQLIHWE